MVNGCICVWVLYVCVYACLHITNTYPCMHNYCIQTKYRMTKSTASLKILQTFSLHPLSFPIILGVRPSFPFGDCVILKKIRGCGGQKDKIDFFEDLPPHTHHHHQQPVPRRLSPPPRRKARLAFQAAPAPQEPVVWDRQGCGAAVSTTDSSRGGRPLPAAPRPPPAALRGFAGLRGGGIPPRLPAALTTLDRGQGAGEGGHTRTR